MGRIPVTNPIPGANAGGGVGLEHTLVATVTNAQLLALRATPVVVVPRTPGKLAVLHYANWWRTDATTAFTGPTGTPNLTLYYRGRANRPIIQRDSGFLIVTQDQLHIDVATDSEPQFSGADADILVAVLDGADSLEFTGGSGDLKIQIAYDLIDALTV